MNWNISSSALREFPESRFSNEDSRASGSFEKSLLGETSPEEHMQDRQREEASSGGISGPWRVASISCHKATVQYPLHPLRFEPLAVYTTQPFLPFCTFGQSYSSGLWQSSRCWWRGGETTRTGRGALETRKRDWGDLRSAPQCPLPSK